MTNFTDTKLNKTFNVLVMIVYFVRSEYMYLSSQAEGWSTS